MQRNIAKTIQIINEISPSFCAAKWYNATIWLGNGRTASCHLPLAHSIPLDGLSENPSKLHNTDYKINRREEMLQGVRPSECAYCWTVEDKRDKDVHSDRVYKSYIYSENEIKLLKEIGLRNIDPKTLEISFDNLCNLSCSYCNSEFSSTWASNIKQAGVYPNMRTSGGMSYHNDGQAAMPFGQKNENNPYIDAFFDWFHTSLKYSLDELRVTGGEPTRSPSFWKLLEECDETDFNFAVNSNLIMDQERLQKFILSTKKFKKFDLYTSCETAGKQAEFIRAGLDYDIWYNNLIQFANDANYRSIHIMLTISALSVWGITEFIDEILALRKQYKKNQFYMSINILRYPSFQNINVLSEELKSICAKKINLWLKTVEGLTDIERNQLERLETYIRTVERSYEDNDSLVNKQHDLKVFIKEYSKRNNLDYRSVFNLDFVEWIDTL